MQIELNEIEFARIVKYTEQLNGIRKQIQQLQAQGAEITDVREVSWLVANQRAKLENEELRDVDIPTMIDDQGRALVSIDATTKIAEWQTE